MYDRNKFRDLNRYLISDDQEQPVFDPAAGAADMPADVADPMELAKSELNIDPAVLEARRLRDQDVAQSYIAQGLAQIGAGLAGQKADTSVFGAARAAAQNRANELMGDAKLARAKTSEAVKLALSADRAKASADKDARDFEQRERMIQATIGDRRDRMEEKKEARLDKEVAGLSDDISKTGIVEAQNLFNEIDSVMLNPKYKKDLPGFGGFEGTVLATPGAGRVASWFTSDDSKKLRQGIQSLMNVTLKDRSGTAISMPEFERFKAEFGAGAFKTEQELKIALDRVRKEFESKKENIMAGTNPEALSTYAGRGNRDLVTPKSVSYTAPRVMTDADKQAAAWAQANPQDPRAAAIKARLGL